VLLNPPDVDVPAPTAVPSPRQSSQRVEPAKDAITGNSNECGIGEEADDAYESDDSGDEDYRGDIYEDEYSDGEDSNDLLLQYRVPSARGKGAGRKPNAGRPPKPDTKGMSEEDAEAAVTEWEKKWKKINDANRRTAAAAAALQDFDESIDPSCEVYSGVCTRTLREMRDVEINPLRKGHTFPNKEILMLRIAEEANLFGVRIQSRRSDSFQLQTYGAAGDPFHVHGNYRSTKRMWVVTECETRIGRTKYIPRRVGNSSGGQDDVLSASDRMIVDPEDSAAIPSNDETFEAGIFDAAGIFEGNEGNADDSDDEDDEAEKTPQTGRKQTRVKSPIKSKWLVPLVKVPIAEKPNISNKALMQLLSPYVVDKFLTNSLLNVTKKYLRNHLFGDPAQNVTYLPQLLLELEKAGHQYEVITESSASVRRKLEEMVLQQHIALEKASGVKLVKQDKIDFIAKWRKDNKAVLLKEGLLESQSDGNTFLDGIFVSLSTAVATVPLLQHVYQADAAHMNFGKYSLYSCYGVTSNGNTFPVCFGILFGNEDKEGWTRFWKFATKIHPCINRPVTTVITDQQKGSIPAFAEVVPLAVNFFCSFHRRQNIKKFVKGGTGSYSCMWLYNLLMNAKTPATIDKLKFEHAGEMQNNALRFLASIPDSQQFPAARCGMGNDICMYQRTASSSVESMNRANQRVQDRTAVDPINSLILLIKLEAMRFEKHRENAWGCTEDLTPHSKKLAKDAFQKVNVRDYSIKIGMEGDTYCCVVNRLTSSNKYTTRIPINDTHGSFFGSCNCGVPRVDGFPCQHMIAVCKSGRIEGLNESNIMPYWWHTSHWRKQYPQGVSVGSNFSIEMMKNGERDDRYKLCPAISGPNKTGRPKLDKRHKSLIEQATEKKKKQHQAKQAKKKLTTTATKAGKGKKRKAEDTKTQAQLKKQVARDGTKRVSERQRKK
jgi:hypothetical protein